MGRMGSLHDNLWKRFNYRIHFKIDNFLKDTGNAVEHAQTSIQPAPASHINENNAKSVNARVNTVVTATTLLMSTNQPVPGPKTLNLIARVVTAPCDLPVLASRNFSTIIILIFASGRKQLA